MCGIAGAVWSDSAPPIDGAVLRRMTDVLRHRGPDGEGSYLSEVVLPRAHGGHTHVALGHRRLSIIDRLGGRQPMSNEDGTVWVTFNGEIYNFPLLR
jgi:asparagine synthase (glutamine-hydrolysing)